MARKASIQIGGYFPTPDHIARDLGAVFRITKKIWVADPCAGDGAACLGFLSKVSVVDTKVEFKYESTIHTILNEIEETRFSKIENNIENLENTLFRGRFYKTHADAFLIEGAPNSIDILFLNPPYEQGVMEEKFLTRFTPFLKENGYLVFIVPEYSLPRMADYITKNYKVEGVFRFPEQDYKVFKQIALIAKSTRESNQNSFDWNHIQPWAELSNLKIEVTGSSYFSYTGESTWFVQPADFQGIFEKTKDLMVTKFSDIPPVEILGNEKHDSVMPPRASHIGAAIAAGIFNGVFLSAQNKERILLKGVFRKDYKTVDEKYNKEGNLTGVVQVQQPSLVVTCLNVENGSLNTVTDINELLTSYGEALMKAFNEKLNIWYTPEKGGDTLPASRLKRPLFKAQQDVSEALKLLIKRRNFGFLLGEIGSGKTSVAADVAVSFGSKAVLVICPPHLLASWKREINNILPDYEVVEINDCEDLVNIKSKEKPTFYLMSREYAKLGWAIKGHAECPACGNTFNDGVDTIVKKRVQCQGARVIPKNQASYLIQTLAYIMAFNNGEESKILGSSLNTRFARKRKNIYKTKPYGYDKIKGIIGDILAQPEDNSTKDDFLNMVIYAWALGVDITNFQKDKYDFSLKLMVKMLTGEHHDAQNFADVYRQFFSYRYVNYSSLFNGEEIQLTYNGLSVALKNGRFVVNGSRTENDLLKQFIGYASKVYGSFSKEICKEPLYGFDSLKRIPLSKLLTKSRYKRLFDFIVVDECHEYGTKGSAQERAIHRIVQNMGVKTLMMTGTIMNGYADSLFTNFWFVSQKFRNEFQFSDISRFVERYGYRKRFLSNDDFVKEGTERGITTDRLEKARIIGEAPGILPLFLLRHLMPFSVTLHKEDLSQDIPECVLKPCKIDLKENPELKKNFENFQARLIDQASKDMFTAMAGKLFGQLVEMPSYLDRAPLGDFIARYPNGGDIVATGIKTPSLLPKEKWLLQTLEEEFAKDRNVLLLVWHLDLIKHLKGLIHAKFGKIADFLDAKKVSPNMRQAWIDSNVVEKKLKVLICNPIAVQTGLNNLIHFSSEIWYENPGCNATVFRQAIGRVDRIGQKKETNIFFPVYGETIQEKLYDLLGHKVAVATAADGLDPESVLESIGAIEGDSMDAYANLSLGRFIFEQLKSLG